MPDATDAQIDKVREIAGENNYASIALLIDNLTDGQWARALQLIVAWDAEYPAGESIRLTGNVTLDPHIDAGLDIRSRMRLLLGLPELRSVAVTGDSGSIVLRNEFVF
jgi:hypothetical protein